MSIPKREWYGNYVLAADLAALALVLSGMAATSMSSEIGDKIMLAGVGTYAVGGPIVHFSQGQVGNGFGSLALRVLLPIASATAGAYIAVAANSGCTSDGCGLTSFAIGAGIGFAAGAVGAAIIDNTLLPYKEVPQKRLAWSVLPSYHPATGHHGVAIQGTF